MSQLTQEYFDKHYEELVDFLGKQFLRMEKKVDSGFEETKSGFQEQSIKLDFIQVEIASIRKELAALAKRTKEDDSAFVKDLLKLKNRIESLEKQFKKLKVAHA